MEPNIPNAIKDAAELAMAKLIPDKSKNLYDNAFRKFNEWCDVQKVPTINETVLLAYFQVMSKNYKPSSLWSCYSMLKTTLRTNKGIDISPFNNLLAYLKRVSNGYKPKKPKIFKRSDIDNFLKEADDGNFLLLKVVLIVGVYGACRKEELLKMQAHHINDLGHQIQISIPDNKTNLPRLFLLTDLNLMTIFRKYTDLRPSTLTNNNLFLAYRNGKCINQNVVINTFGKMPQLIAKFLKLPDSEQYTGHCFRRTSASLLADVVDDPVVLMRHGGWKSRTVAEGYVEQSIEKKRQIANQILEEPIPDTNSLPKKSSSATATCTSTSSSSTKEINVTANNELLRNISFTSCSNFSINFYNS